MVDVSTLIALLPPEKESGCYAHLHAILSALETDLCLFRSSQLRERLIALDNLDAASGGFDFEDAMSSTLPPLHQRAKALQIRLEAANSELYQSMRSEMIHGTEATKGRLKTGMRLFGR